MHPTSTTTDIITIIEDLRTFWNYSGCFIELCRLIITPLPSNANTAIPKNMGMFSG
jgi:hypothetical protein